MVQTNLFLSTSLTWHNSNRPTMTTVSICDKGSKQSGKVEVLPFLAVCQISGFRSKFWILLLCLTAFASPHLSWINFDNDLCLRSTMRTMGCCLSYFNIVGAFFFSVIENEVPWSKKREIFYDCVSIFVGLYTALVLLPLFFSSFHFLCLRVGFSGSGTGSGAI